MTEGNLLLEAERLEASYGKLKVLYGVSLNARAGEVVAIVGRNGTGKSTTLKAIFGLVRLEAGRVWLDGREITNRRAAENVRDGLVLVPQTSNVGRGIFPGLSVAENLELGAFNARQDVGLEERKRRVYELLPVLRDQRRGVKAGFLSGGQQQMLALGIALMSTPRLLLLDEPTSGLSPIVAKTLAQSIREISHRLGVAVLLVEQNIRLALQISDRVYVIRTGRVVREDIPERILGASNLLEVL